MPRPEAPIGDAERSLYALPTFFMTRITWVMTEVNDLPSRPWLGAMGIAFCVATD
jgi:hypothetical protein